MAALLESLLHSKVELSETVLWLKGQHVCESQDFQSKVSKEEFVPFLLNFLREQSSQTLTHGPTTPAKTPSTSRSVRTQHSSDRRGNKSTPVQGLRSTSRVQLFSPAPSMSPVGGRGEQETPFTGSQCLSGVSTFSSPSFSSVWSPAPRNTPSERRSAQRASLGDFMTSPPETQPSPSAQQHKGRRRSGGFGGCSSGRQTGTRVAVSEEGGRWEGGGRKSRGVARIEPVSPPTQVQLNFNNLEDFPPVGAAQSSPVATKPSRRINPTPVSAERPNSKPKSCFTSTPLSLPASPPTIPESAGAKLTGGSPLSLQEERELLRKERSKLAQQTSSPLKTTPAICTPTKTVQRQGSKVTPDPQSPCPDPDKVTQRSELDLLAELYCTCISENLVPCVFLELFFVLQLLTSRGVSVSESAEEGISVCEHSPDVLEKAYLGNVHNCVYFSVKVLENQFELVSHLDKCTLRLLSENERVGTFSSSLRDRLAQAQDNCTAKVLPSPPLFVHSVPFQPATDNRSNFSSDRAFHTFKKQRDVFYGLIREWEDSHKEPGWDFEAALGNRVRMMVSQLTAAGSHSHFARLFQKQLIQMCKSPCALGSSSDAPDADLLGMLGADSLGRLKRLQQRLVQPQGLIGPCPPPSFPGHQEFFKGFLQTASCCQLNQHLKDGLCQQLLKLDEVSIFGPDASPARGEETGDGDMEQQDEKQRFSSVLLTARLLAKFLGFISFLPYQTSELPSRDIQDAAVTLRSKSSPVLDVCAVLRSSVHRRRTILTVPWMVEFLSMLDYIGPFLPYYRTALCLLLQIYKRMVLGRGGELCYMNQLLMVAVLGWLFQIPIFPEDLFFSTDLEEEIKELESNTSSQGLDTLPLVDQQLLLTCCPYLGEFRKLLAAFVAGSTSKSGGLIRKITPTSAELRGPSTTRSQHKLQVDLEQAFFHNQPPSLRRTVEFVAERVGSNCVKHIKATLVLELVKGGEKTLRDSLGLEGVNPTKLNDSICAQLCDAGMQALERATRFCSENAPGAVRVLLPLETSSSVLTTAESITTRLATEKACSWLSSNITTLLKREWKSAFDRVMKSVPSTFSLDAEEGEGSSKSQQVQRSASGLSAVSSCVSDCTHKVPLGSEVMIEVKEVLSVSVGPRSDEEVFTVHQIESLLDRVGQTLGCRKLLSPVVEQMLLRCTVQLACKLVSGELPLVFSAEGNKRPALLEKFLALWARTPSPPLHLLFSELTLTAVCSATDSELKERGLLGEDEVGINWPKLSALSWPEESVKKFQQLSLTTQFPVPSLPNHRDILQVSQ
ncbi:codanin-1 isoform X2 [Ctenopharyngodon idella]|uniref:codanin-1 isoform X2 n=1 Tax=Ctenopharyngodon idella TaxID=7959 RepID=UPI00222F3334|nr:codanin-1 isoform X2 [Ctenopharyngodon idella]